MKTVVALGLLSLSLIADVHLPAQVVGSGGGGGGSHSTGGGVMGGWVGTMTTPVGRTGAPFCADVETQSTQTLASGAHINVEGHGKQCRDSAGRTYSDDQPAVAVQGARPEMFRHVTINDPVEGRIVSLVPQEKLAHVLRFKPPTIDQRQRPQPQAHLAFRASKRTVNFEDLGDRVIEGTSVHGQRTTMTIPEGEVGNDAPLTTVTETWTSDELGTAILEIFKSDQSGETTRKLTNIQRTEPDPSLFQIPADYKVEEQRQPRNSGPS